MELLEKRKCHYIGLYFMQIVTKEALRILFRSTDGLSDELKKESEFIIDNEVNKHFLKYLVSPQTPVALDNNTKLFIDEKIPSLMKESLRLDISKISEAGKTCTNSREFYNTLRAEYPVDETYDSIFPTLRKNYNYEGTCFENFGYGINSWGLDLIQEELCERYTRTNSAKISYERAKIDLTRCTTIIGANCSFRARYKDHDYIFFGERHVLPDTNVPYDPHSISLYSFLQCIFAVSPEKKYDLFFEQASLHISEFTKFIDVKKPGGFSDESLLSFTTYYFRNYLSLVTRDYEDIYPNLRLHNLDARERYDSNVNFPKRIRPKPGQQVSDLYELLSSDTIRKELSKIHPDERAYILNFARNQIDALKELYTTRSSLMYRQNELGSKNEEFLNHIRLTIPEESQLTENQLLEQINNYTRYTNPTEFQADYFALLTDVYAFARMIRKFEGYDSDCTIVFSGTSHTMNYFEIFSNLPGCEIIGDIRITSGTPYLTESNIERQYLHFFDTKDAISARAFAEHYFDLPEETFLEIGKNRETLLDLFAQIRVREGRDYYLKKLREIMKFIEEDFSDYEPTPEDHSFDNEIFQRCLFKFYVLLVKYLESVESISFENYKKFVRTLNYFQVGSTSNYTSYHKKINTLVLSKMPAYSPPSTPSPTVRPLVPPNVPGNQESDIPEEKSDIEEFYLQQQKRRKY